MVKNPGCGAASETFVSEESVFGESVSEESVSEESISGVSVSSVDAGSFAGEEDWLESFLSDVLTAGLQPQVISTIALRMKKINSRFTKIPPLSVSYHKKAEKERGGIIMVKKDKRLVENYTGRISGFTGK